MSGPTKAELQAEIDAMRRLDEFQWGFVALTDAIEDLLPANYWPQELKEARWRKAGNIIAAAVTYHGLGPYVRDKV